MTTSTPVTPISQTARPVRWLGAPATYGLALPAAQPSASQLYAPRGVFMNDDVFITVDSGNHRVLIWHNPLPESHSSADVVLGQADFVSEGPKLLHLPTGVVVFDGMLFIADAWHHRILIWDSLPEVNNQPPDRVLGQADVNGTEPNRGANVTATSFYWPYGLGYVHGRFYVTDTQNRRVLYWHGLPDTDQPPDGILGQEDFETMLENRGGIIGPKSFRWPHAVAGDDTTLFIADAGNHRVLGWSPIPNGDVDANIVLGQQDFITGQEWPYGPQNASALRFPYAISQDGSKLAIADTANNRVVIHNTLPTTGIYKPADMVVGQPDFTANGENHWKAVTDETLCWPYGIHLHNNYLAIADSGNNRVMVWELGTDSSK